MGLPPPSGAIMNRAMMSLLLPVAAAMLTGCWTPPTADTRPGGPSRIVDQRIIVRSMLPLAIVQSVDPATRTIVMQKSDASASRAYRVAPTVPDLTHISVGVKVCATVSEELTVYVSPDGRLPGAEVPSAATASKARVLSVDPSYRLLTLQDADGATETFKVGLKARLAQMQAGDDVMIQPLEVVSLSMCKR